MNRTDILNLQKHINFKINELLKKQYKQSGAELELISLDDLYAIFKKSNI